MQFCGKRPTPQVYITKLSNFAVAGTLDNDIIEWRPLHTQDASAEVLTLDMAHPLRDMFHHEHREGLVEWANFSTTSESETVMHMDIEYDQTDSRKIVKIFNILFLKNVQAGFCRVFKPPKFGASKIDGIDESKSSNGIWKGGTFIVVE
uniref:Uncharacterized protein n=1 Tax=Romanomermis culicivorax TaxID=13658 RepID=A0A915J2S1_ROMCU